MRLGFISGTKKKMKIFREKISEFEKNNEENTIVERI
jgi:hypothetical protein